MKKCMVFSLIIIGFLYICNCADAVILKSHETFENSKFFTENKPVKDESCGNMLRARVLCYSVVTKEFKYDLTLLGQDNIVKTYIVKVPKDYSKNKFLYQNIIELICEAVLPYFPTEFDVSLYSDLYLADLYWSENDPPNKEKRESLINKALNSPPSNMNLREYLIEVLNRIIQKEEFRFTLQNFPVKQKNLNIVKNVVPNDENVYFRICFGPYHLLKHDPTMETDNKSLNRSLTAN